MNECSTKFSFALVITYFGSSHFNVLRHLCTDLKRSEGATCTISVSTPKTASFIALFVRTLPTPTNFPVCLHLLLREELHLQSS